MVRICMLAKNKQLVADEDIFIISEFFSLILNTFKLRSSDASDSKQLFWVKKRFSGSKNSYKFSKIIKKCPICVQKSNSSIV